MAAAVAKPVHVRGAQRRAPLPITAVKDPFRALTPSAGANWASRDHHCFDDRSRKSKVLICFMAGYKPELWQYAMPRFSAAATQGDICLVTPGLRSDDLRKHCRTEGWSYLGTAVPDVSLAQNLCYQLHPYASMFVKVDEDMFLLPDTITKLLSQYHAIKADGVVDLGFIAPMMPLNGICYRPLLEMLGLLGDFEHRFGKARSAHAGLPIQDDPKTARWIWEKTAPLSATAEKLGRKPPVHLPCSIRLNIGMIAFERKFWRDVGYLPVNRRRLGAGLTTQGADEEHICGKAVTLSRPGVVTTAALAGHFAFNAQYESMLKLLKRRPKLFSV